jgi:aldose 1-epimerase
MPDQTTEAGPAGLAVPEITLTGASGLRLVVIPLGARITRLWAPDRDGALADIVLGHDRPQDYLTRRGYLGATCGRYANRIAGARFSLDASQIRLAPNEGENQLHGGPRGFDAAIWAVADQSPSHVTFTHLSPAGDMGFPGTLRASCTYRLDGLCLWIEMTATTDAPTVVNLAHHSYFNLAGHGSGEVMGHDLQIAAQHYLPVDAANIPTGAILPVAGTPFDFTTARPIGQALPGPAGFDHCFCLSEPPMPRDGQLLRPCAVLTDRASGRCLRLSTDAPGLQVYTGAHFDGETAKAGACYPRFAGVALETQGFPDSPNRPQFPSTRLDPGQTYTHTMLLDLAPVAGQR